MAKIRPSKSKVYHAGQWYGEYESYSSISKWMRCPVEFGMNYFEHDREPSTLPLVFGNAMHAFVEQTLINKQLNGPDFGPEKARARWEACWLDQMSLAEKSSSGLRIDQQSPEVLFDQGVALAELWITKWLPKIDPRDVEQNFVIGLKDISRKIYGKLDYTTMASTLDDVKTSGRPYVNAKEDYELQFAVYHVGYYSLYKEWPKKANVMRFETVRTPDIEEIDISLSHEEVQAAFDDIVRPKMIEICAAWESGIFECTCKKKHETLNFFEKQAQVEEARLAKEAADDRILDPGKYADEKFEANLIAATELRKSEQEAAKANDDAIPF